MTYFGSQMSQNLSHLGSQALEWPLKKSCTPFLLEPPLLLPPHQPSEKSEHFLFYCTETTNALWCKSLPLFDHLPPPKQRNSRFFLLGFVIEGLLVPPMCLWGKKYNEHQKGWQAQPRDEASPNHTFCTIKNGCYFQAPPAQEESKALSHFLLLQVWEGPQLWWRAQAHTGPMRLPP